MDQISLTPYIFFGGNAKEALEFYKGVFGGELTMQTMGEVPDDAMPPGMNKEEIKDQIMHGELKSGAIHLFVSDSQKASKAAAKIELSVSGTDDAALRKIWDGLSKGGKITMPLAKQFWGAEFGMISDKFGVDWMVNIEPAKT